MKKTVLRILSLIMAVSMLMPVLCGCGNTEKTTEQGSESESETAEVVRDVDLDLTKFKIICGGRPNDATARIRGAITKAFGINIEVLTDSREAYAEGNCEILVGETNRPISQELCAAVGENEYCIKFIDDKTIVIAGKDDESLEKAAEVFVNKYIHYDTAARAYSVSKLTVPSNMDIRGYTVGFNKVNDTTKLGFQVQPDGTITLAGKPYQGIGMNWHGGFLLSLSNVKAGANYDLPVYFQTLADNGIPYIRTMMGVFYGNEVPAWYKDKEGFFKAMDNYVALAEEYHIGIIFSLLWDMSAFVVYNHEKLSDLAKEDSKTIQLCREYVTDVVTRYKDSPAVWGWEIGNEGNLAVDLGNGITTDMLNKYYTIIGTTIHDIDPTRMIVGGDSYPRAASKSLRTRGSWSPIDKREDVKDTFMLYTPAPLNTISVHIYGSKPAKSVLSLIEDLKKKTDELKIGCFVGEFGLGDFAFGNLYDEIGPDDPREAEEQSLWKEMLDTFINAGTQVLCAWCYGRMIEQTDGTSIEYGMYNNIYQNAYQMDYIREYNKSLAGSGKNCAAEYWDSVLTGEKYQMEAYKTEQ